NALCGNFLETAGITAVGTVHFLFELVSRKTNLLRVDDDDVIAAVQVRSELRFILANQYARHSRGYAAQHLSGGIYHNPLGTLRKCFRFAALWNICPHTR